MLLAICYPLLTLTGFTGIDEYALIANFTIIMILLLVLINLLWSSTMMLQSCYKKMKLLRYRRLHRLNMKTKKSEAVVEVSDFDIECEDISQQS